MVIPDGVFTYTAANNIGLASTGLNAGTAVVVGQPADYLLLGRHQLDV